MHNTLYNKWNIQYFKFDTGKDMDVHVVVNIGNCLNKVSADQYLRPSNYNFNPFAAEFSQKFRFLPLNQFFGCNMTLNCLKFSVKGISYWGNIIDFP